jgi:hypothetical protein
VQRAPKAFAWARTGIRPQGPFRCTLRTPLVVSAAHGCVRPAFADPSQAHNYESASRESVESKPPRHAAPIAPRLGAACESR